MINFLNILMLILLLTFFNNHVYSRSTDSPDLDFNIKTEITWDEWIKLTKKKFEKKNLKKVL